MRRQRRRTLQTIRYCKLIASNKDKVFSDIASLHCSSRSSNQNRVWGFSSVSSYGSSFWWGKADSGTEKEWLTAPQDTVNLPKVAKLFWSHADEERSHAIQFIQYLRMRGAENTDFFGGAAIQPRERVLKWTGVEEVSLHI
jgi:hypothetical protein